MFFLKSDTKKVAASSYFLFWSFERKHAMGSMRLEFQSDPRVQATAARNLWQIYKFSDCRV